MKRCLSFIIAIGLVLIPYQPAFLVLAKDYGTLKAGKVDLHGTTSGKLTLQPGAAAGNVTFTLPDADGTKGQVLQTNGSGTLSWADSAGANSTPVLRPMFHAWRTDNAQKPGFNTPTTVIWQHIEKDTCSGWSAANNTWTPCVAGYYHFFASVEVLTQPLGNSYSTVLTWDKAGSNLVASAPMYVDGHRQNGTTAQSSAFAYFNGTTDHIKLQVHHDCGSGNATVEADSWIFGYLVDGYTNTGGTGGTTSNDFANLTTGTNTSATMTVGTGAAMNSSGTGYIAANKLNITGQTEGDILYFNGSSWVRLGKSVGKYLQSGANSVAWADGTSSSVDSAGTNSVSWKINKDYTTGDYDSTLYFNGTSASLIYEYMSSLSLSQFTLSDKLRIYNTTNSSSNIGSDNQAWELRVGATYSFPEWSYGVKAMYAGLFELANDVNSTTPEASVLEAFGYSMTADSKAGLYGVEAQLTKKYPCTTSNTLIGLDSIIESDVTPSSFHHGAGVRAYSGDVNYTSSVRQSVAFFSTGNKGWDYPFLALDTDLITTLADIDKYGNGYFKGNVTNNGYLGTNGNIVLFTNGNALRARLYGTSNFVNMGYLNSSDNYVLGEGANYVYIGHDSAVSSPIYLRIGGSDKNVTYGAANSCGDGYRCLLVPN